LTLGQHNAALMVPTKAIIPQARDKKVIVIKNGIAYFETVTTGIRTQDMVEIISGISEGDTIAVSGIMFIKPQAKVKISTVVSSL
ncbi:MAG TPA: efflux transporter periplasmic adaptor subunit, partial [Candidatus Kapabacteria bacterium]|nr:efflux transporter periplasmic adaptor subunit [Candidatus Kapabacteria bacterium]